MSETQPSLQSQTLVSRVTSSDLEIITECELLSFHGASPIGGRLFSPPRLALYESCLPPRQWPDLPSIVHFRARNLMSGKTLLFKAELQVDLDDGSTRVVGMALVTAPDGHGNRRTWMESMRGDYLYPAVDWTDEHLRKPPRWLNKEFLQLFFGKILEVRRQLLPDQKFYTL